MPPEEEYFDSVEPARQFDLVWVMGFLSRYRWWIAGITTLALIPAIAIPFTSPDKYQAIARVTVQARPEAMEMGSDYMPRDRTPNQNPLNREVQLALSDAVLGRVVDQLPSAPGKPDWFDRALAYVGLGHAERQLAPAQLRKARIEGLKYQIEVQAAGSELLEVSAQSAAPDGATFLANAVAEAIVDYNRDEQRESYDRTVTWLQTQVLELRERISTNQSTLSQHIAKHGLVTDPSSKDQKNPRLQLQEQLEDTDLELQTVRSRLRELPAQLANPSPDGDYDPELMRLQQRYEAERRALEEARLMYTPTHPEMQRREDVVRRIEKELSMWGPVTPLVGVSEADQREYRALKGKEAELRARRSVVQRRLDEQSDPTSEKTRAMTEYERLQRQLDLDRDMLGMLMRKREEVVLSAGADLTRARVLDRAIPPVEPIGPNRLRGLLIGVILAFGAGIGVSLARELLDQTIRDPEDAMRLIGVPVIGIVPVVRDGTPPERQSEGLPSSIPAESYRNLRTALLFSSASQGFTTLVVTSGVAGEGKTTVSANLASSFAQAGRSVLLIDADMRVPRVHKIFSVSASPGLSELLRGESMLESSVRRPSDGRFDVITAGRQPTNPSELLASPEFAMLLARVRTQYDLVIVDSPVLLGISDTQLLASQADATLVVHRPGSLAKRGVRELRARLDQAGARILGTVLNQIPRRDRHFYPAYMESPYLPATRDRGRKALKV